MLSRQCAATKKTNRTRTKIDNNEENADPNIPAGTAAPPPLRSARPSRRLRTFDALQAYRDFRFLWVGNLFANTAQWLQLLTVGWLVRDLTESSSSSGLLVVTAAGINTVPVLLLGPWFGVLGDRVDRRKMVMVIQGIMAAAASFFAVVVQLGVAEWWHAYIYMTVGGVCWSATLPMRQTLVANTVPREALVNAYAVNVITITGTRIVGPFAGGLLIATLSFTWNFSFEALLYIGTVLAFIPMNTPYYQEPAKGPRPSPLSQFMEGIRYIRKEERVILNLIFLGLIPNVLLHPVWFLLPVFTVNVLHRSADVGGYLLAITGFGGLISSLIIASVGFIYRRGMVCLVMVFISSITVVLFAHSHWLAPAMVIIGVMAMAQATFRTSSGTLIQALVPDHIRGRVTSLEMYSQGLLIFSSLAVGWLIDLTSVVTAITVVGLAGLGLGAIAYAILPRVKAAP